MKQIIILFSLLYFISCVNTEYEDRLGPAHNIDERLETTLSCSDLYVVQGDNWLDDSPDTTFVPSGASDCVDLHLWSKQKNRYYDKCCYVRFHIKGNMHSGCIGLGQDNFNDSTETIRRMEQGDRDIWTREAVNSKVYQLDCHSTFVKVLTGASILLALIL